MITATSRLFADPTDRLGSIEVSVSAISLTERSGAVLASVPATLRLDWSDRGWFISSIRLDQSDLDGVDLGIAHEGLGRITLRAVGVFRGQAPNNGRVDYSLTVESLSDDVWVALPDLVERERAALQRRRGFGRVRLLPASCAA